MWGAHDFRSPDNAPPDFVHQLLTKMRAKPFMPKPFDCRLAEGWKVISHEAWVEAKMDIDYHLRHSATRIPVASANWANWWNVCIPTLST